MNKSELLNALQICSSVYIWSDKASKYIETSKEIVKRATLTTYTEQDHEFDAMLSTQYLLIG